MLPLKLSDWDRFRILDLTLERFFRDLGVCWIVTRDDEFDELTSRIGDPHYRVVRESEVVPEFRLFENVAGWFKQQLIKLAIAGRIATEYYLTLDADVVCTRTLRYSDLIKHDRAGCYIQPSDIHPEWYDWAERVLGLRRSGACHAVTPAVYARDGMLKLQSYLSGPANHRKSRRNWRNKFKFAPQITEESQLAESPRPWVVRLLRDLPWTEQSLYFTFLEATGQFEQFHFHARNSLYSAHSLWEKNQMSSWDPHISTGGEDDHSFFLVVQSSTCIDPQVVREKLRSLLRLDTVE